MSPHHAERSQLLYLFQPDNNKGRSLVKLFLLKKTVLHISVISVRKQFFISVRKLDPNQGTQQNVPKQNGKLYITFRSIGQKKNGNPFLYVYNNKNYFLLEFSIFFKFQGLDYF